MSDAPIYVVDGAHTTGGQLVNLDHVQALRGTTHLDDDFSIIEAFFP